MSRVGNKPIHVPDAVKVTLSGREVSVEGPKGKLVFEHHEVIAVCEDNENKCLLVQRPNNERLSRSLHGTTRSLIANMVEGVANGFERKLELYGVGYSATLNGRKLSLVCGRANPAELMVPDGIEVEVSMAQSRGDNDPARFVVRGCDKQKVGQFAAQCRSARKPEPYKGKGIRYAGERIIRKVGKAFAGAGG
ncbi:MAG: 50S ribosomal protein L6 [Planctomycetes bacterium]|nr:50S ribosomal protein L6 [Planctomycetota bacterium]